MNGEEPDRVLLLLDDGAFTLRGSERLLILEPARETPVRADLPLEGPGARDGFPDVRDALLAVRPEKRELHVLRPAEELEHRARWAVLVSSAVELREKRERRGQTLERAARPCAGREIVKPPAVSREEEYLLVARAEHRRAERRDEGERIVRILDRPDRGCEVANLLARVVELSSLDDIRNSFRPEWFLVAVDPRRPGIDHGDIPVAERPPLAHPRVHDGDAPFNEPVNEPRDRFPLALADLACFHLFAVELELHRHEGVTRSRPAGMDRLVPGLEGGAFFGSHDLREGLVHPCDDAGDGAEVLRDREHGAGPGEAILHALVHLDVRFAKAVYALLRIPDDEELSRLGFARPAVARRSGEQPDDLGLNGIRILKLVDEEVAIAIAQRIERRVVRKELPDANEEIVEIEDALRRFPLRDEIEKPVNESLDALPQTIGNARSLALLQGGEIFEDLLLLRACLGGTPIALIPLAPRQREREEGIRRLVPLEAADRAHLFYELVDRHLPTILGIHAAVARELRKARRGAGELLPERRRLFLRRGLPGACGVSVASSVPAARTRRHPSVVEEALARALPAPRVDRVREPAKRFDRPTEAGESQDRLLPRLHTLPEKVIPAFIEEEVALDRVELDEIRIEARLDRMLPENRRREGVDRRDRGALELARGGIEVRARGGGEIPVAEALADLLAKADLHLPRRLLGERDRDDARAGRRAALHDRKEAAHEQRRLPRAGARFHAEGGAEIRGGALAGRGIDEGRSVVLHSSSSPPRIAR